ncbi:MAG: sigma-70 family RNA polymerase sigma factor [Gammaproteobacteria bacterium]|nr:sigma-70 family RNA polymerase sigma factor [Gammaproteobacteria bacterium]
MPESSTALSELDERRLVTATADGDLAAFESLYRAYFPRLARFLTRMMNTADAVEEVINDAMLVVWQKAGTYHGSSRVSTWIFGIAYLKALKALEKIRNRMAEKHAADGLGNLQADGSISESVELQDLLQAGLAQLPPHQRAVVELTFTMGYSYREIAEIVGCPENTVKTRMYHARERLKHVLPELTNGHQQSDIRRSMK